MKDSPWELGENTDKHCRADWQPALFHLANCICIYRHTDGFCSPKNRENCKCWDLAEKMMDATGMSAKACGYVMEHTSQIEEAAKK